jgi:hypothetical protein
VSNKPTHHQIEVYGAELHIATSLKAWAKLRKRIDSLDEEPGGLGFTSLDLHESELGATWPHLSIFVDLAAHGDDQPMLVNTCAHEAAHAAGLLLDHIGEQYGGRSEAHAYLVGAIAASIWATAKA